MHYNYEREAMNLKKIIGIIICMLLIGTVLTVNGKVGMYERNFRHQSLKLNEYDMVIIVPEIFSTSMQPLINHKNSIDIQTILKTTEEIYAEYDGRDNAEQIKYFIANMEKSYGIKYVLLVGSIYKLPMRISCVEFAGMDWSLLTDLYYSDLYDTNRIFCSWDSNVILSMILMLSLIKSFIMRQKHMDKNGLKI